jgi:hypothetical protein
MNTSAKIPETGTELERLDQLQEGVNEAWAEVTKAAEALITVSNRLFNVQAAIRIRREIVEREMNTQQQ